MFICDKLCGVEVTDKDNPTSLLKYGNNYGSNIFVCTAYGVDVKQYLITSGVAKSATTFIHEELCGVEVTHSGKPISLIKCGINNCCKKFYSRNSLHWF